MRGRGGFEVTVVVGLAGGDAIVVNHISDLLRRGAGVDVVASDDCGPITELSYLVLWFDCATRSHLR